MLKTFRSSQYFRLSVNKGFWPYIGRLPIRIILIRNLSINGLVRQAAQIFQFFLSSQNQNPTTSLALFFTAEKGELLGQYLTKTCACAYVNKCVCVCVNMCVCLSACVVICFQARVREQACACVCKCACVHVDVCTTCACAYVRVCVKLI